MYQRRKFGILLAIVVLFAALLFIFTKTELFHTAPWFIQGKGEERVENVIEAFNSGKRYVIISRSSNSELNHIIDAVYDAPDLFWLDLQYRVLSIGDISVLIVKEKYEDIEKRQQLIDEAVNKIISECIRDDMSEYEKVLAIHDWICDNVLYGEGADGSDQDIYGTLIYKKARCAGYAKTFTYLLNKVNIKSQVVSGESYNKNGERYDHAWNLVYIDGNPYYFDITWNDDENGEYDYDWFGVTSQEFKKAHFPNIGYEWVETVNTDACYYFKNNMYINEYRLEYFVEQIKKQGNLFSLKCSNENVLRDVINVLEDKEEMQRIIKSAGVENVDRIVYTENLYTNCVHVQLVIKED